MKIHFIIHECFEAPAAIRQWAETKQHDISYSHVHQGKPLPDNADNFDFLIVMGGPQSPATTLKECPHFDAKKEIDLIGHAVDQKKLVFGVCLGAQLIGEAFGAPFESSPHREIGVFPITLTESAQQDTIFKAFPKTLSVGHWHGDMPGLSSEATVLATSEGCPRQIIKFNERAYGFQCHFELTPHAVAEMIKNNRHEFNVFKKLPYIQDESALLNHNFTEMNRWLFHFLDSITT